MSRRNDCKLNWLHGAGYVSDINTAWSNYLKDQGFTGQINDQEYAWLGSLGYAGELNDRWFAYLRDQGASGALPDMLTQWWCGEGGVGPGPGGSFLFDARFDSYDDGNTLTMNNGEQLHDDYPANGVGIIRKGIAKYVAPSAQPATLADGVFYYPSPASNERFEEASPIPRELGITGISNMKAEAAGFWGLYIYTDTNQPMYGIHVTGGETRCRTYTPAAANVEMRLPAPVGFDVTQFNEFKVVLSPFNAAGQPDPVGTDGALYIMNGRIRMSTTFTRTTGFRPYTQALTPVPGCVIDKLQSKVDPALLETPQRSIFIGSAGTTPIDEWQTQEGALWTHTRGVSMPTVGSAGASGNNGAVHIDNPGGYFWEMKAAVGDGCFMDIRHVDAVNRFAANLWDTFLELYEILDNVSVKRASTTVAAGYGQRLVVSDDDNVIIPMHPAEHTKSLAYTSTVHAGATQVGFAFSGSGIVEWYAARTGSVRALP